MSEEIFDDSFNNLEENNKQRPPFLTVLIVLTWIAVGFSILGSITSITNSSDATEQIEESMKVLDGIPMDNQDVVNMMKDYKSFIETTIQNIIPLNLSNLILYLIEGFAVLLMYNLKKIGFWVYVLCQFGFIAVFINFYPDDNVLTTISITFSVITSVIFCILYGLNLKHLTK